MESVLLRVTVATLIAFLGAGIAVALGRLAQRRLTVLVVIAAAALLLVTLGDVLPEAKANLTWSELIAAVASGALLFWLISRFIHPICPACSSSAENNSVRERLQKDAILLMAAVAIHSAFDGMAVAVGDGPAGAANIPLMAAISIHKLPEGLALALLLLGAGYSRPTAFAWTCAVELTTELGGLIGVFWLRDLSPLWLSLIFAHVGGGFLYLVGLAASAFGNHAKIPSSLLDTSARKTL